MGIWPTHDWNDNPYLPSTKEHHLAHVVKWLAVGYYGVLRVATTDLEFYYHGFKLENSGHGPTPCIFGRCDWDDLNWRDFRPTAPWWDHLYTKASWLAAHPEHIALFDLPFISILNNVFGDWMRVKYLGVGQYFLGSILWLLVFNILPWSPQKNLETVWGCVLEGYRLHNTPHNERYGCISINVFKNTGQPRLKGRAARIKHLIPNMRYCFNQVMVEDQTERGCQYLATHVVSTRLNQCHIQQVQNCVGGSYYWRRR